MKCRFAGIGPTWANCFLARHGVLRDHRRRIQPMPWGRFGAADFFFVCLQSGPGVFLAAPLPSWLYDLFGTRKKCCCCMSCMLCVKHVRMTHEWTTHTCFTMHWLFVVNARDMYIHHSCFAFFADTHCSWWHWQCPSICGLPLLCNPPDNIQWDCRDDNYSLPTVFS